jgi:4-amino-4-deoxy-L-arabinose transferase-like glycosyltransferase
LLTFRRTISAHPDAAALSLILLVGATSRLALLVGAPAFVHGDSFQYYRPAHMLMSGDGFPLPLKRPPAYPVFVALVGSSFGTDLRNLLTVQAVLGLSTAALAYGVGRLSLGRAAGLVAGLVAALSGGILIWEHYVMSEALFTFLLTLSVFLYLAGLRTGRWWWLIGSGLATGLAALTRPHGVVLPVVGLFAAALYYRRWRPTLRVAGLTALAAALVLVPWMARNKVVHGAFTLGGSVGQTLIAQMALFHPGEYRFFDPAEPSTEPDSGRRWVSRLIQQVTDEKASGSESEWAAVTIHGALRRRYHLSEIQADAIMREVAFDAIRARPLTHARVASEDIWMMLMGTPEDFDHHWKQSIPPDDRSKLARLMRGPSPQQEQTRPALERLVNIYQSPSLGPLVPLLFLAGLAASAKLPAWGLALVPGLVVLALHVISALTAGFIPRYHYPPDPLMHVVAFGGLLYLYRQAQTVARVVQGVFGSRLRGRATAEPGRT